MSGRVRIGIALGALLLFSHSIVHAQAPVDEGLDAVERRIEAHEYQEAREALLRWQESDAANAASGARVRARYLEALLAGDPAAAERLFLRLAVDHPSSPEAADALLRVGQSRYAAREHDGARTVFDRLLRDYPDSDARVRGAYWAILNHLASGREAEACGTLDVVRGPESESLRERLAHIDLRCPDAYVPREPAAPREPPTARDAAPVHDDRRQVVVEAGPFPTTEEAVSVRDRLAAAGLPALLVRRSVEQGTRVWIGEPGPRTERSELAEQVRALGVEVRVVPLDPEG